MVEEETTTKDSAEVGVTLYPLESTNVVAAGFDADNGILLVEFKGGRLYRWDGIPEAVYKGIMEDSSPGKYYYQKIERVYGAGVRV